MRKCILWLSLFLLLRVSPAEAQGIKVNGIRIDGARSNLNIVVDVIEFRQDDDPAVRLTTSKKHYGLSVISPRPVPTFDAELPASDFPPHYFTVVVEDGREFSGCVVAGLKSSGADPSHNLAYVLACGNVSTPPLPCSACE
jgi:hypothetical protein